MFRNARKLCVVLMALFMVFVLSVSVGAEVFNNPRKPDIEGDVIGNISEDGFTATFTLEDGVGKNVKYVLKGDGIDNEYWNQQDAYIEVDITLNTDSSTVYAVIAGTAKSWAWVSPTLWNKYLKYGQTVTIREPFSTYYKGFQGEEPHAILIQLYSSANEPETIEVHIGDIRVVGVSSQTPEQTTTAATTTATTVATTTTTAAPIETEPEVPETVEAEIITEETVTEEVTEDTVMTSETSEQTDVTTIESENDTTNSTESESAATDVTATESERLTTDEAATESESTNTAVTMTAATTPVTTATALTTAAPIVSGGFNLGGAIIAIVAIVVVIIAVAVVGYMIYKKKKYY